MTDSPKKPTRARPLTDTSNLTGARAQIFQALVGHPGSSATTLAVAAGLGRCTGQGPRHAGRPGDRRTREGQQHIRQRHPGPLAPAPRHCTRPDTSAPWKPGDRTRVGPRHPGDRQCGRRGIGGRADGLRSAKARTGTGAPVHRHRYGSTASPGPEPGGAAREEQHRIRTPAGRSLARSRPKPGAGRPSSSRGRPRRRPAR